MRVVERRQVKQKKRAEGRKAEVCRGKERGERRVEG